MCLDVVGFYQQVEQNSRSGQARGLRGLLWGKLSKLLQGLPARNFLLLGADANSVCCSTPGLVGRGVPRTGVRIADPEFMQVIRDQNLTALNTWGKATRQHACTFTHGTTRSQIDFVFTRRATADQQAKRTCPVALDLTPWRLGPKHSPLAGSLPFVAGWVMLPLRAKTNDPPGISIPALRGAFRRDDPILQSEVKPLICTLFREHMDAGSQSIGALNKQILAACASYFPQHKCPKLLRPPPKPESDVQSGIHTLWSLHRQLKVARAAARTRPSLAVSSAAVALQQQYRALKRLSRRARRQRLVHFINLAQAAAQQGKLSEVYRIVRILAPRKTRDHTAIRSPEGHLLSQQQQFAAIRGHFREAYARSEVYEAPAGRAEFQLSQAEVEQAINTLKTGKAVPGQSLPAELWKLCQLEFSQFLHGILQQGADSGHTYPPEVSDCTLALLPKPGKVSKPLGLQDPSSKIFATVLRHRVTEAAQELLASRPQFAYSEGKAIDSAITRVALHCAEVRNLLKHQSLSVHDKRQGRQVAGVCGGAMVSLDLSRAFDQLPRWALQASLEYAQVDGPVIQAIIAVHERCSYTICHGKHTDSVPMRKGVRQGCTLSPSLYAIFTIWVYDRLSSITSAEWASACITLFADDSHLSWLVRSVEDLEFVCTCTRRTIELFQSVGMQINVSKSRIVLRVRGSRAKRWPRACSQHRDLTTAHTPPESPDYGLLRHRCLISELRAANVPTSACHCHADQASVDQSPALR